ncbi:hypothetical protein [Lacinutrix sp. MedPE-SW]|uniref:hypothetical protein n=1 Tax=Lacinutrix sp. MedPE-SW TaxID=1860087 RepID=UPI00091E463F|nr:hypothetical protein [Lacinutrix sp. MedPE-SW]OIQ24018.1 MAG: hypothetical protein BM549_01535 [Lacinutrix sp. MedPE-SW]
MKEFFIAYYSIIIKALEILAAVTGIICFKKFKGHHERYFIYFLIYILFVENIGSYTIYINKYESLRFIKELVAGTIFQKNYWWYQIFWVSGSALFLCFYYYKIEKNKNAKKNISRLGYVFLLISILLIVFKSQTLKNNNIEILDVLSFITILLLIINYFFQTLNTEKILKFYYNLTFYISCGFLIFIILITPLTFFESYFNTSDWNFIILKWQIMFFANVFMYSTFTVGLIVSKPNKLIT